MKKILNTITILLMLVSVGSFAQVSHPVPAITIPQTIVDLPIGSWMGSVLGDTNIGSIATGGQINMAAPNGVYISNTLGLGNLTVDGTILTSKLRIAAKGGVNWAWADYVFAKEYKLKPLTEVALFIKNNKHLEGMPTTNDVKKDGLDMAPITAKLLEKIEELTLYAIEHNKQMEIQNKQIVTLIEKNELQAKEIEALKIKR